jgi:hypothetical protein
LHPKVIGETALQVHLDHLPSISGVIMTLCLMNW